MALLEPDGDALAADGEVGEIAVGGRMGHRLFVGYLDDKATTTASFRDGRFRTGDLARRDAAGRYSFVGRRGDVLKVAGENVSTVEVEEVLAEHAASTRSLLSASPTSSATRFRWRMLLRHPGAISWRRS